MNFKVIFFLGLMGMGISLYAQPVFYHADSAASIIKFTTMGPFGEVGGNLYGLQAAIRFDENHPDSGSFVATVRAASIKTGLSMRDEHLTEHEDMFDAAVYPLFTFKSVKIAGNVAGGYEILGNLTIKNVTRQVALPFTIQKTSSGAIFKGVMAIDAHDYAIGSEAKPVKVELEVHALRDITR